MKFHFFGDKEKPVLMLLPGTCCQWEQNFGHVIDLLTPIFHVICVSYDGFEKTENSTFSDIITQVQKIEDYIISNKNSKIFAAYGCSMGGSLAGLLLERNNIQISHAILGSTDLDQVDGIKAKLLAAIAAPYFYHVVVKGKMPKWLIERNIKRSSEKYATAMIHKMFSVGSGGAAHISKKSIKNQFYSDLVTPLGEKIDCDSSCVHILYALKMGEKYRERYLRHFAKPNIIEHDLFHEELLLCYPEEWVNTITKVCGLN